MTTNTSLLKRFLSILLILNLSTSLHAEEYKMGIVIPLSGSVASLGNYLKNGFELAYNQLPAELQKKISLHFEDDAWEKTKTVAAYKKLRTFDKVDSVFILGSSSGNAVCPIAEKDKVICVAVGASDFKVAKDKNYSFIHWITPEAEADIMVDELVRRDFKKVGLLFAEQEGANALYDALKASLKKRNALNLIAFERKYLQSQKDFRLFITQSKSENLDVVIVVLFPGQISTLAKQARDMKYQPQLTSFELFEDEAEVKAADGALEGAWYINADIPSGSFLESYQKSFKAYPGWGAANAYDTLKMIAEAVEKYGNDNQKIAEHLRKIKDFEGSFGTYSATGDNRFVLPGAVKAVKDGGFIKLR